MIKAFILSTLYAILIGLCASVVARPYNVSVGDALQLPDERYLGGIALDEFTKGAKPGYGKYCGKGVTGSGAPVDGLDRCCQAHDKCHKFCVVSTQNCSCQKQLLSCAYKQKNTCWFFSSSKFCRAARAVYLYAKLARTAGCYKMTSSILNKLPIGMCE